MRVFLAIEWRYLWKSEYSTSSQGTSFIISIKDVVSNAEIAVHSSNSSSSGVVICRIVFQTI